MAHEAGKHLLISVPDYYPDERARTLSGQRIELTSCIRLGKAWDLSATDQYYPGRDLFELALPADDPIFIDDERSRDDYDLQSDYDGVTEAERAAISLRLLEDGGWYDHSDGNRITTTRGDKVEVIRGNYKMLVLGRQDTASNAAGWDVSGGHIQDAGLAPGGTTEIKWVKDKWSGTWKIVEQTEKGEVHEIFHGNVTEEMYGDTLTSITGSESAGDTQDTWYTTTLGNEPASPFDDGGSRTTQPIYQPNPHVIEKTWARKIESYTGSETKPVPEMLEKTWATKIESYTGSETKRVGEIIEEVHATKITTTTKADTIIETVNMSSSTSTTTGGATEIWAGGFCEIFAGANMSLRLAASAEISVALLAIEAFIGVAFQVFIGKCWELKIGWFNEIRLGPSTEIMTSEATEYVLGESKWTGLTAKKKAAAIFLN